MTEKLEELKEELEKLAKRVCWSDDEEFNSMDNFGGNLDDAYFGGSQDGETILARRLLKEYFG